MKYIKMTYINLHKFIFKKTLSAFINTTSSASEERPYCKCTNQ